MQHTAIENHQKSMTMKRLILFLLFGLFLLNASAQIQVGVRAGLSTTNLSPSDLLLVLDNTEELGLKINDAKFGILAGLLVRIELDRLIIQPELIFTSNRVDFDVTDFSTVSTATQLFTEEYQYLDLPIMVGYKFEFFRIMGGLEGHIFLNSTSDLVDFDNYEQNFSTMTFGWQLGAGIDISKFMIDLRYQGNFSKFGNHITFGGREFQFDQSPSRLMLSAGFLF